MAAESSDHGLEWARRMVSNDKERQATCAKEFKAADKDGGGSLDVEEVMDMITKQCGAIGIKLPQKEKMKELVAAVDKDHSGEIDLKEFQTLKTLLKACIKEAEKAAEKEAVEKAEQAQLLMQRAAAAKAVQQTMTSTAPSTTHSSSATRVEPIAALSTSTGRELREPLQTSQPEESRRRRYCACIPVACTPCCLLAIALLLLLGIVAAVTGAVLGHGGGGKAPVPPPVKCEIQGCSEVHVPDAAENCGGATCSKCQDGFVPPLDPRSLEPSISACSFQCKPEQKASGCRVDSCLQDGSCAACLPGYELQGSLRNGQAKTCVRATKPVKMNFFMYRAQDSEKYPPENTDLASAAGVMWYLHNEVVKCPRRFNISRVLRYNVTVYNPAEVYPVIKGQFGHFVQFDYGACTNPECGKFWEKFGYAVGCQSQPANFGYRGSDFYSLPGHCPSQAISTKTDDCKLAEPGGMCSSPNGTRSCTWSAELAGEVSLDDLSGISGGIDKFCAAGNKEYEPSKDKGVGTDFWDDRLNATRNDQRVFKLLQLFAKTYHDVNALSMPAPICTGL